ncbi:MAG: thioesterase [Rhodospirillaceae bacterium]|nr:thioesterase [Rhodospirillales bacterium]
MLPFAGDSGNGYGALLPLRGHPDRARFQQICLPGHGERMAEPLLTDLDALAADAFRQIAPKMRNCDVLYGHSMGALLALAVVRRARALLFPLPRAIVVSGMRGPSRFVARARAKLSREGLREELRRLGGSPGEILDNDEMFDFFEPLIRADFSAVENYRYGAEPPLPVPITVIVGDEDEVTADEADAWQRETAHPLTLTSMPGGHFFIYRHATVMRETLMAALASRRES